jgi:hypothetical protein
MANPGEASQSVVTKDKPKMLLKNGDSRVRHGGFEEVKKWKLGGR